MRQKLAIARALLHEPPVLFLDEPTAALDPEAARLVRDFIAELKSEGRTIFICTHNLDEADRLCDRVAVFKQTLRVVDRPANLRHLLHGRQVKIQLAGEALPYVPHLAALPQVQHVQANGRDLLLTLADPETDNPALIRLLVAEGAAVQYVSEVQQTLEDAYLHLLDEDDNAESAS
jgi:ABC-2 type transport system ATP-binding protein